MQTILLTIFGTFCFCLFLVALAVGGYWMYRSRKKQIEVQEQFCKAVETLSSVAKDLSDIPKLIAGHGNAAGAIAIEVAKLRDSIDRFVGVVVKPRETEAGVDYTKEEDASLHWEVAQVLAEDPSVGIERAKEIAEGRIAEQAALPHLGME